MRITDVAVSTLDVPLREPLVTAAQRWERRRIMLLSLRTDTGLEGVGEVASEDWRGGSIVHRRELGGLVGLEVEDVGAVRSTLEVIDAKMGQGRPLRSAVETALEVLAAANAGSSLARWLDAASRREVAVNALVGIEPPDVAATTAAGLVAAGFRCLKLKGGGEPVPTLAARVAAVRSAVDPAVALRVDLNASFDESTAQEALAALSPWDIEYVEQPVAAASGPATLARLRSGSNVAIAADESISGVPAARALLDSAAVDVLVVKPARVGGVRQARAIVDMADAAGIPVTISTLLESGVGIAAALHLAATIPADRAHGLGTARTLRSDLLDEELTITDGRMTVPTTPGLGIRLDPAALTAYTRS